MSLQLEIYAYTTSCHENITKEFPAFQTEGWLRRCQEVKDKWQREKFILRANGNLTIDKLIDAIVSNRSYPKYDNEGEHIEYELGRVQIDMSSLQDQNGLNLLFKLLANAPLTRNATLDEEGIQDEEKLVLYPGLHAGGPDPLTIAAGVAAITQVVLMVVDMWLRRSKNDEVNNTKEEKSKTKIKYDMRLALIREIRMEMSDGNWVKFDDFSRLELKLKWIKRYIEIFNDPSASPKLIKVVLIFKNGSKAFLNVSSESEGKQLIEKLLEFIEETFK